MSISAEKLTILVVDDEPSIVKSIQRSLEDDYQVLGAANALEAREIFSRKDRIALILSDQRMPGESGAELLQWVRENHPDTIRILITGYSDFDSLVTAINQGQVYQYIQKPWEPLDLELLVQKGIEVYRLTQENKRLQEALHQRNQMLERENVQLRSELPQGEELFTSMIGLSPAMTSLKKKLRNLLPSQSTVLVTGESGTGKELVARALHFNGSRRDRVFVAQNCAALPDSILESELFGHVKGAFTHALETRIGILESADGGTLFLDEVGDMTLSMQAKLLRFLQEGTLTPVGGRTEKTVDVRVIAATHRNLEAMVEEKTFREDLYYRLNVIPLRTPALRERKEDIPLLAEHFLRTKSEKVCRTGVTLSPEAKDALRRYPFPGNVRELENALEYCLNLVGDHCAIEVSDLPDKIRGSSPEVSSAEDGLGIPWELSLDEAVEALEKKWIEKAMQDHQGNISQSARKLGLSRQGLHNKLSKYNIHA